MDLKTLGVVKPRQPAYVAPAHDITAPSNHRLRLHKARIERRPATEPFKLSSAGLPVAHRVAT
jgi:hypothetical protein